jgi:hypothetical protein
MREDFNVDDARDLIMEKTSLKEYPDLIDEILLDVDGFDEEMLPIITNMIIFVLESKFKYLAIDCGCTTGIMKSSEVIRKYLRKVHSDCELLYITKDEYYPDEHDMCLNRDYTWLPKEVNKTGTVYFKCDDGLTALDICDTLMCLGHHQFFRFQALHEYSLKSDNDVLHIQFRM